MNTQISPLDPDLVVDVATRSGAVSRRDALRKTALYGAALAASPLALAALSKEAYGQTALPLAVQNVLRFALTLEHLEYEFYRDGLATPGLVAASERPILETIAAHENDHVRYLQTTLGLPQEATVAGGRPEFGFDFTAGGTLPTFTSYPTFLVVSQGLEDTGVRAYKGQAPALIPVDGILQAALQIHSVEARHASAIRRIRGQKGWITGTMTDNAAIQATYNGDGATMTVPGFTADQVSESFDEPLTKDQVSNAQGTGIADAFIRRS